MLISRGRAVAVAWAEDADGELMTGVLAYEAGWREFFPETNVWTPEQSPGRRYGLTVLRPTKLPPLRSVRRRIRVAKRTPVCSETPGTEKIVGKPRA